MKRSCSYCGRIHPRGFVCSQKPVYHKNKQQKDKFRSTAVWQKMRERIARRDDYMCRVCILDNTICSSIEVHHIVPLCEDYSKRLDPYNLISLCPAHHKKADAGEIDVDILRGLAKQLEDGADNGAV